MELTDLIDQNWKGNEKKRFLKDDTKAKTDDFDPESFKHDGFEDRERYLERFVPALASTERLDTEINDFTPPRLKTINSSPYQALVLRYGILRQLIQQPDYSIGRDELLDAVQSWQTSIIEGYGEDDFQDDDDLLHLAKAVVDYKNEIDDSELHMVYSYFELRNRSRDSKHEYYTWLDFFKRLSAISRFPKVSRSDSPEHALDTIKKGIWSLQEQAIVYEVNTSSANELVGIPEEYVDFIRDWLYYEMSEDNYLRMLETLEPFDRQSLLVNARENFGIESGTQGRNDKRRESLVRGGVFPSELLEYSLTKDELKAIVDRYGLDAHKQKTDQMILATIEYFEQSQKSVEANDVGPELYLSSYEDIADGTVEQVPPQLQDLVDEDDAAAKLDVLFEDATGEIFSEIFNLDSTNQLGQQSSGVVADGEIEQDGEWLLWDNKRRAGKFKLDANTRSKIKNYVDTKAEQHDVEWFLIIAPDFSESAVTRAKELEIQIGTDVRLLRAADFKQLAELWRDNYANSRRELPLALFNGTGLFEPDVAGNVLSKQFS